MENSEKSGIFQGNNGRTHETTKLPAYLIRIQRLPFIAAILWVGMRQIIVTRVRLEGIHRQSRLIFDAASLIDIYASLEKEYPRI